MKLRKCGGSRIELHSRLMRCKKNIRFLKGLLSSKVPSKLDKTKNEVLLGMDAAEIDCIMPKRVCFLLQYTIALGPDICRC